MATDLDRELAEIAGDGFVEGINRAIRGIINRAFGFRNLDNFLQVLVECGGT